MARIDLGVVAGCFVSLTLVLGAACSRSGGWTHTAKKDEMTDNVRHRVSSTSETQLSWNGESYRPEIAVDLEKGKVGIFLHPRVDPAVDQGFGPNETQNIVVRFDDEPAMDIVAPVDGDKKRLQVPGAAKLLPLMLGRQKMLVQYRTMFAGGGSKEKTVEWKLDGFKAALTKMCSSEPICTRESAPLLYQVLTDEGIELKGGTT